MEPSGPIPKFVACRRTTGERERATRRIGSGGLERPEGPLTNFPGIVSLSETSQSKGQAMSIFGQIMGKIFGEKAAAPASGSAASPEPAAPPLQPASGGSQTSVDVAAVLDEKAAHSHERLNWKHSIVDLMKLLGLDSSLSARQQLAQELGYSASLDGSAEM